MRADSLLVLLLVLVSLLRAWFNKFGDFAVVTFFIANELINVVNVLQVLELNPPSRASARFFLFQLFQLLFFANLIDRLENRIFLDDGLGSPCYTASYWSTEDLEVVQAFHTGEGSVNAALLRQFLGCILTSGYKWPVQLSKLFRCGNSFFRVVLKVVTFWR